MILGLLLLVDFILLCSWDISDPVRRQTRELLPEVHTHTHIHSSYTLQSDPVGKQRLRFSSRIRFSITDGRKGNIFHFFTVKIHVIHVKTIHHGIIVGIAVRFSTRAVEYKEVHFILGFLRRCRNNTSVRELCERLYELLVGCYIYIQRLITGKEGFTLN